MENLYMEQQSWNSKSTLELYQSILKSMLYPALHEWFALDITLAQLKVLFLLSQESPKTVGAVAQTIGISLPTASQLIERLVQSGLVQRVESSTDRRVTHVSLTESGDRLVRRLRQGQQERLRDWIESLSEEETIQLRTGLLALARLAQHSLTEERSKSAATENVFLQN
jgi:DNA-binding MarR family transcriptional regulator